MQGGDQNLEDTEKQRGQAKPVGAERDLNQDRGLKLFNSRLLTGVLAPSFSEPSWSHL